jgi:hypothetical protein
MTNSKEIFHFAYRWALVREIPKVLADRKKRNFNDPPTRGTGHDVQLWLLLIPENNPLILVGVML